MPNSSFLHRHSVQFYGSDQALFTTVGSFVAEALSAEQPAILIVTSAHREGVTEELVRRMIDVDRAVATGHLTFHDAQESLARFMRSGAPDPLLFGQSIGHIVVNAVRRFPGTVIRAYGEMVDILWQQGDRDAAIKLELLWEKLAQEHRFALLCGYSMGSFYKLATEHQEIRDLHTHVIESDETEPPTLN